MYKIRKVRLKKCYKIINTKTKKVMMLCSNKNEALKQVSLLKNTDKHKSIQDALELQLSNRNNLITSTNFSKKMKTRLLENMNEFSMNELSQLINYIRLGYTYKTARNKIIPSKVSFNKSLII